MLETNPYNLYNGHSDNCKKPEITEDREILTTLGISRNNVKIYSPENIEELKSNFLTLRENFKNISISSTGNNWGYGCNAPSVSDSLMINLSKCKNIVEFDAYHGTITFEPGVTYGEMAEYLKNAGGEWITPVHGGGPDCSVMGNALERGYGITPIADHFSAIQSLSAILNNGEVYEGSLKKIGQDKLEKLFRYGIGPYTDGLFSQSGIGIVTEMTIRLAANPKYVEMFYFNIKNEESLEEAIEAVKLCKRQLGSNVGGINLINKERCLSMFIDFPKDKVLSGEPLSKKEIDSFAKKHLLTPWLVVGMIYGEKGNVKESKKIILKNFKKIKMKKFFYNTDNKKKYNFLSRVFNKIGMPRYSMMINKLFEAYTVLTGTPSNVALKLAYWKNPNSDLVKQATLNPAKDNCGIIWYAPLVEMKGQVVLEYVDFIKESSLKFNINSLITLTTVDDLCFDSTVPILFNRENEMESKRAYKYYQYLLVEGAKKGFFPYRLNIETQKEFNFQNDFLTIEAVNPNRYK